MRRPISRRVACLGSILGRVYIGSSKLFKKLPTLCWCFCWFSTKMVGPHIYTHIYTHTHTHTYTHTPIYTYTHTRFGCFGVWWAQLQCSNRNPHPAGRHNPQARSVGTPVLQSPRGKFSMHNRQEPPVLQAQSVGIPALVAPIGGSREEYCAVLRG